MRQLGQLLRTPALLAQVRADGKWRTPETEVRVEESSLETASALLQKGAAEELVDFDNHLDDLKQDFLNVDLNMMIDQCS